MSGIPLLSKGVDKEYLSVQFVGRGIPEHLRNLIQKSEEFTVAVPNKELILRLTQVIILPL